MLLFGEEPQRRVDLFGVEADPFTPQLHERRFERDERLELLLAERVPAQGKLPAVFHQLVQAHHALTDSVTRGLGGYTRPQAQTGARAVSPGRNQDAEATLFEQGCAVTQEVKSFVDAQP